LDCFLDSAVLSLGYMKGWFLCGGGTVCVCVLSLWVQFFGGGLDETSACLLSFLHIIEH
jgi:hypothetical protein